jgi:hypothetical protein
MASNFFDTSPFFNPIPSTDFTKFGLDSFGSPKEDMVSSFLGAPARAAGFDLPYNTYDPFKGTSLGKDWLAETQKSLTTNPDYSSTFYNAARGLSSSGKPISGGGGGGGGGSPGGLGYGTRSSARLGGGGGGGGYAGSPQAPLDFYKGPAPTMQGLNLDYQEMGRRALEANTPYKQQYEQMNPGLYAGLKSMGQLANQQLSGQIPLDVAQQIGRSSAAAKLGAGISNSNLGRNLTARDLGLSSLQIQQSGADLLARSSALTQQAMQAMNPISPNQVFDTASSQASYNSQIANQNLMNAWQSQGLPGQFDITKGQFVGYTPGSYSSAPPVAPWIAGKPLRADQRKALEYIQSRPMGSGKPAWMTTSYASQAADKNARNREIARILAS